MAIQTPSKCSAKEGEHCFMNILITCIPAAKEAPVSSPFTAPSLSLEIQNTCMLLIPSSYITNVCAANISTKNLTADKALVGLVLALVGQDIVPQLTRELTSC